MPNTFTNGKRAIAECDRCGFRFKLNQLRTLVIKTKNVNLKVCEACWEPDHPQLQLGMYPVADPQALFDPRPDRVEYAQMRASIQPVYSYLSGSERTFATGSVGTVGIDTPVDVAVSGVPSTFYLGTATVDTPPSVTYGLRTTLALPSVSQYWDVSAYGNGVFVTLASYDGYAARSADGINWTYVSGLPSVQFVAMAYGAGLFVAIATNTSTYATSPDGITWTTRTLPFAIGNAYMAFANGVFITVYNGNSILRSTDGINWSQITSGISTTITTYMGAAYGNGIWLVTSSPPTSSPVRYLTSTDNGVTWTTRTYPSWFSANPFSKPKARSTVFGAGRFAIPFNGSGPDNMATTVDGINWQAGTVNINTTMDTMAYGGDRFFWRSITSSTTNGEKSWYSTDGLTWQEVLADAGTGNLRGYGTIAFDGTKFLWAGNGVSPFINVNTYGPVIELPATASGDNNHIQFMRLRAINTWPAYNQRSAYLGAYFKRPGLSQYDFCNLLPGSQEQNTFNYVSSGVSNDAYWGDRDGGTANQRDPKWDIAAGVSRIFEFSPTSVSGLAMDVNSFEGVSFGFSLQLRSLGTPIFIEGRVAVDIISGAGSILASREYYANDPTWFQGNKNVNSGDPFDVAI